jgi:glyoxylase-like metal-dependent hydrolase (beta-lactamase superfamily II)
MEEILPHLYRIVVPLPGNPLKEINSYVLTSDDRNLIIDTGMNRPECRKALEAGFAEIGLDLERTDIIVTHMHVDHQGLVATFLAEGSKAYMGDADATLLKSRKTPHARMSPFAQYAVSSGLPEKDFEVMAKNHPGFKYGPQAVVDYIELYGGEVFKIGNYTLKTVATPGHTQGHMCLYEVEKKVLFSGDHVLGDITPNIQAWSDQGDPLDQYLKSLRKVKDLDVKMCLPGHRSVIADFRHRVEELIEHHRIRANEVLSILKEGTRNGYQTASKMTWDIEAASWKEFPLMQKWFATGEANAHLKYLQGKRRVRSEIKDGQVFYSAVRSCLFEPFTP